MDKSCHWVTGSSPDDSRTEFARLCWANATTTASSTFQVTTIEVSHTPQGGRGF